MEGQSPGFRQMIWPFVKLAAISGLVFIIALTLVLSVVAWRYQDHVSKLFLEEVNKNLQTDIFVEKLTLNLLRSFPMAALSFETVSIMETAGSDTQKKLLQAEAIRLQFNLMDILRKNYHVRQVVISNGSLNPEIRKGGEPNYLFWKSESEDGSDHIHFNIQRIQLNNMLLHFIHHDQSIDIQQEIKNLQLSILYQDQVLGLNAKGDLHSRHLQIKHMILPESRPLALDLSMQINNEGHVLLHPGKIYWNNHAFQIEGDFISYNGQLHVESKVNSSNIRLASFKNDLPLSIQAKLRPYVFDGVVDAQAVIQGWLREESAPNIHLDFSIKSGLFKIPETEIELSSIHADGKYTNGSLRTSQTSELSLRNAAGNISDGKFQGSAMVRNFIHPEISMKVKADLKAGEFVKLLRIDNVSEAGGQITLDADLAGKLNSWTKITAQELLNARLAGRLSISDGSLGFKGKGILPYKGLQGVITFANNTFLVEQLKGTIGESSFALTGQMANMLPYLFIPEELIYVQAGLVSSRLVIDELLQHSTHGADTIYRLQLPKRLRLHLHTNVDTLTFRRFDAENLQGEFRMLNQQLFADNLNFLTMDGHVELQGVIDASHNDHIDMNCEARLHKVDINQLFYQMGNFGQLNITDKHIFGDVTAEVFFSSAWSKDLNIDWSSLETIARLRIDHGKLLEYLPLVELGRFLRIDGMNEVSFQTLENEIHIQNSIIHIPDMTVMSSALNLQVSGQHTFENEIDYRLQILLSDLLARNHRERRNPQEQYGDIIDDGLGRTTLFLRLTGTANDPVFRYDHQGVRDKIRQDLRQERETMLNIFQREFNFLRRQRNDTLINDREKEMQRIRQQEQGRFIFEWENRDPS